MCLITSGKRLVAEEDIVCYKMLKQIDDCHYSTPFRKVIVELGHTYESKLVENGGKVCLGLHSFKDKDQVLDYVKRFWLDMLFVKCVIPKGSEYYEGCFVSGLTDKALHSFASDRIKYTEEIVYKR